MENDKKQLTISFSYKSLSLLMVVLYVATIGVMLFLWQPWNTLSDDARRITVTGEATVEAEPDEFVFYPTYNIVADSKDAVIQEAADKANTVVDGLKDLGVADEDIKVDGSSYDWYWYREDDKDRASVSITATVNDKDLAQEVQNYLLSTEPEGQLTPYPSFSTAKQEELETQARSEAVSDAKLNAQASANELEVKLGDVISVSEGTGFGDYPIAYAETRVGGLDVAEDSASSIPIQPGQNEFYYSVTVVYELK
jgi:uncharacterized protein YggE